MKNFFIASMTILAATVVSCHREQNLTSYDSRINTFEELSGNFADPPQEFRTVPFWVWNTRVSRELIDRDLEDYKKHGFGGVFVHPRYGLITDYLSEDWFDLVSYAVSKGKELGLYVWLYDENSFPSGFAGGHVPAEMPSSWDEGMALKLEKQTILQPSPDKEYKHILMRQQDEWTDITDDPGNYLGREGEYLLYELLYFPRSKWYGGYSYVDLLHKGVTEKFIELTMTGYEQAVGEDFGGWVPGIFTDEPNINPEVRGMVIRWTPDLYSAFRDQWGYELLPNLLSLVEETGEWTKVRHDYYATLLQLFIDRWSRPWYEYTEGKKLKWTGHYWEHGWPNPQHGGDNMAMYAWHQVPAIDMLFNTWNERPDQFGNARAVKELSSVANQFGRRRTLSETYGGSGWELTFRDMKRNGDWEYVVGVNLMNQHLSYMTLMGDRKHDFPQSFSFHDPYWDYYPYQADYFARLSLALASGEQQNNILVIEPTSTMWMHYNPAGRNERMYELGQAFEDFIDELERYQVEYDIGCENIINDHGKVSDGKFIINQRAYDMVVLPPGLENLDGETVTLLGQYMAEGGKILSFVPPPGYMDGAPDGMVRQMFEDYQGQCFVSEGHLTAAETDLLAAGPVTFDNPEILTGMLFHHRREMKDGQLLFLVNSSLEESSRGSFTAEGKTVLSMEPATGRITRYPSVMQDGRLAVTFDLDPAGSLLLFISVKEEDYPVPSPVPQTWLVNDATGETKIIPSSENVLVLDYCLLTMGEDHQEEQYFYAASDKIFKLHGFEDNPWVSSSQYKTGIIDLDTFPAGRSGFMVDFVFLVGEGTQTDGMKAVVERPGLYQVSLNGTEIWPEEGAWWLDPEFGVYNVDKLVKPGKNTISLVADPMSVYCELAPVFILGNFSLRSVKKGWEIIPAFDPGTGSWSKQGRPFYHDAVSYQETFMIDDPGRPSKVRLGKWNGTVAVVSVNGTEAGIIFSDPYELDVTGKLEQGANTISVKVIGSLKNLLGPHHDVSRRGIVTPWSFKSAPLAQPPGEAYDLLEYGLFEDFILLAGEGNPS